ncbi:MAG: 3-phosphoshikimate 1-carboxyvinyltransferase [Clostridiales bacterium]|jgi:3-phosphoshikimate 1-carboxyvinyltransferase|nr:3-phosphoshikimate 1-carboxyvinyltransferase [Clostridiales bacterium]
MVEVIKKTFLKGRLPVITSKSAAHRIMICAAAADKPTAVTGLNDSADVAATRRCLTALGASFDDACGGVTVVTPIRLSESKKPAEYVDLYCGESGSTLRFLLPFAAAIGARARFFCEGRLPERPIDDLIAVMTKNGAKITREGGAIVVGNGISAGLYRVGGKVSSQFTSGLLMALPTLCGQSKIICDADAESKGYIDLTFDIIKKFGADAEFADGIYDVRGGRPYVSPQKITVEGDWSNAAFFIVAAALNGDVTLCGLDVNSRQPDKKILEIIRRMGGDIKIEANGDIAIKKSRLTAVDIDAGEIPDLVPVLSVAAGAAKGRAVIYNAGRLRLKESDRLAAAAAMINIAGGRAAIDGDSLIIDGADAYRPAVIDSVNDHRMAMSAAVLAYAADGEITVTNARAVEKSYPKFFDDLKKLGE